MQGIDHFSVYRKEDFPEHYHYRNSKRIAPVIGVCDDGWSIGSQANLEQHPGWYTGGTHGYRPELESMTATFIARGAPFKRNYSSEQALANLNIYELLTSLLGIPAAANNGTREALREFFV